MVFILVFGLLAQISNPGELFLTTELEKSNYYLGKDNNYGVYLFILNNNTCFQMGILWSTEDTLSRKSQAAWHHSVGSPFGNDQALQLLQVRRK
jgi:hypothetical protein